MLTDLKQKRHKRKSKFLDKKMTKGILNQIKNLYQHDVSINIHFHQNWLKKMCLTEKSEMVLWPNWAKKSKTKLTANMH